MFIYVSRQSLRLLGTDCNTSPCKSNFHSVSDSFVHTQARRHKHTRKCTTKRNGRKVILVEKDDNSSIIRYNTTI